MGRLYCCTWITADWILAVREINKWQTACANSCLTKEIPSSVFGVNNQIDLYSRGSDQQKKTKREPERVTAAGPVPRATAVWCGHRCHTMNHNWVLLLLLFCKGTFKTDKLTKSSCSFWSL